MVYSHLWHTYGATWQVKLAFLLQIINRMFKLIALPIAMSLIITRLTKSDYTEAQQAVVVFVLFSLLIGITGPLIKYIGVKGENNAYEYLTVSYFQKLLQADIDYFNSNLSGYLTSATRQYVDNGLVLVRSLREKYLGTILSIVFPVAVITYINPWLGLITLALCVAQAVYIMWASHVINPYRSTAREVYKKNSGEMADTISNIMAVKASAQEQHYLAQVRAGAKKESYIFLQRHVTQIKLISMREIITVLFFVALLWLTVSLMSSGKIDITGAVLVVTYAATIMAGVYALSENLDEHDDLVDKIIPAFTLLHRKNSVTDPAKPIHISRLNGAISFRDVSFAYNEHSPNTYALKDLTLTIPKGQKLGVVGVSGAGKSTLTKLLMRFEDVNQGTIRIDNIAINQLRQKDLRSQIAYVPQEPLLFHTSIRQNIIVSKPSASNEEIVAALKIAHAWEFVSKLPNSIESIVGERGVKLSGGQKQRIAIARAVLQNAPIMILDEATSALDSESEQIIKSSFATILKGKTSIVVAHRLSTLSEMDKIIVIDKGTLIESGSHNELLAINGTYTNLWNRQQQLTTRSS